MLCFEVYHNGQKLCIAGVGEFGVLSAILTWVSHNPEKLARWAAEGNSETEPLSLRMSVSGLSHEDSDSPEHLRWADATVGSGDEIRIRVVELAQADVPVRPEQDPPQWVEEQKKAYVRQTAKEFGWELREAGAE